MNPQFQRLFSTIPGGYTAVIAGGAAVNVDLANDIDVFVLNLATEKAIQDFLRDFQAIDRVLGGDLQWEYPDWTISDDYDFPVVATTGIVRPPAQLIAAWCPTVEGLLDTFDISTHAVALTKEGKRIVLPWTTGPTETPTLGDVSHPKRAWVRYRKLCLRYGFQPNPDDLMLLCRTPDTQRLKRSPVMESAPPDDAQPDCDLDNFWDELNKLFNRE